jgi:hypothetical protein
MPISSSRRFTSAAAMAAALMLSACATQIPKISSGSTGYAVSSAMVTADPDEAGLASAISSRFNGATSGARSADADVAITLLRYDSVFFGLFYGGRHHASASVTLRDNGGAVLSTFSATVADDGPRELADGALADQMQRLIEARAASAFPAMTPKPKAAVRTPAPPVPPAPIEAAQPDAMPSSDDGEPCVIGADGNCLPL